LRIIHNNETGAVELIIKKMEAQGKQYAME
jgi:hypothetical protein